MAKMIKDQLALQAAEIRALLTEIVALDHTAQGLESRVQKLSGPATNCLACARRDLLGMCNALKRLSSMQPFSGTHLRLLRRLHERTEKGKWFWPTKQHNWSSALREVLVDLTALRFTVLKYEYDAYRISARGKRFLAEHDASQKKETKKASR
jgi:hypothetical protein